VFEQKKFIFRYNGDAQKEETVVDVRGNDPIPEKNSVIYRRGRLWNVIDVHRTSSGGNRELPVYRVFLQEQK
jgi:hypothetical protein